MAERGGRPNVNPLVKGGGFLYFIQERVKQLKEQKGVDLQGMGLEYQIDKFDPEWKEMSYEQQRPYRDLAKDMKKTNGYKKKKFNQGRKKKRDKSPSDDEDDYLGDDDFYPPGNVAPDSQRQADHSQFDQNRSSAESSPFPSATATGPPPSRVEMADGHVNSAEQWDNPGYHFVRPVLPLVGTIPTFPYAKGPQPAWTQVKNLPSDSFVEPIGEFQQYHDAASVDEEYLSPTGMSRSVTSKPEHISRSQESQYFGDQLGEYDCPPTYYGVPNPTTPDENRQQQNGIESLKHSSILKSDSFESISRDELLSSSVGTPFGPVESQLDLDQVNIDDFYNQPSSTPCLNPIGNLPDQPFEQQPEMFNFHPGMVKTNAAAQELERGEEPEPIRPKRKMPAFLKKNCVAYPKELDMSAEAVEPAYAVEGFERFWAQMPDYVKSDEKIDSMWDELEKFTEVSVVNCVVVANVRTYMLLLDVFFTLPELSGPVEVQQ